MSQAKLSAARELIQEQNYVAARAVLQSIPSNPTAQQWLAKLNQIAPEKPLRKRNRVHTILTLALALIAISTSALLAMERIDTTQRPLTNMMKSYCGLFRYPDETCRAIYAQYSAEELVYCSNVAETANDLNVLAECLREENQIPTENPMLTCRNWICHNQARTPQPAVTLSSP